MSTTYLIPGAVLTEREHIVPLVHGDPQRGSIRLFTREVAAPGDIRYPKLTDSTQSGGLNRSRGRRDASAAADAHLRRQQASAP